MALGHPVSVEDRYFEDYKGGTVYEYGYYEVDEAEVVDFAKRFDPKVASLASPGVEEMHWSSPVRPGDRLKLRTTTIETRLSRSKPDRGLVRTKAELVNQDGAVPMTLVAVNFIARRPS